MNINGDPQSPINPAFVTPQPFFPSTPNAQYGATPATTPARPAPAMTNVRPRAEALTTRQRASRTINETLVQESRYPDLDTYLSHPLSSDYNIPASPSWAPFQKTKMYNIPDQIFEQYNRSQVATGMGLFAELNHAWIVIDNAIYLWDYTHPHPLLVGFDDQKNGINAVKLARPRPGVFLPSITHMLVLATTAEIMLLGVRCETSTGGTKSVTLYQTGMSTSTKGLDVDVIASSESGRIFFGSSMENDVYELQYQQEERWFQGRCSKVNHTDRGLFLFAPLFVFGGKTQESVKQMVVDDSRDLLYTLSSTSCIRVFHMKNDGFLTLTITKPANEIYSNIGHIIASNVALNPSVPIVSISPIPAAEASRYHLVATTATGYRIYLSATGSSHWSSISSSGSPPISMQAFHVVTPPSDLPANQFGIPIAMGATAFQSSLASRIPIHSLTPTRTAQRFSPGYFFCFTPQDSSHQVDTIFISTPDFNRLARPQETALSSKPGETAIWLKLGSKMEDIGVCSAASSTQGYCNELAVQFDTSPTEIAVLTNTGVHVIRRRRLVDIFASLIRTAGGEEGLESQVKTLISMYGRSETLATALAVGCGQGVEMSSDARLLKVGDPDVLDFARKVFIEFGGKPSFNENADAFASPIDAVQPSPRHAGISLYISRLLRSVWKSVIAVQRHSTSGATVVPAVSLSKLRTIQRDLSALQEFFRANKSFIEGLNGPEALARVGTKQEEIALQAEHRAIYSLTQLVSDTIEGISFILVLFDEQVEETVLLLPEESRPRFFSLTFEELFSTDKGHDVARELVKAIVNRNIAKGSNVETVAEALRRRCGTFCSADDVVIFKAQELLRRATDVGGDSELGRSLLNDSLNLFEKVSANLPMDYLQSSVEQYVNNNFFAGAIQLCLEVAGASDRTGRALSWFMDGRPSEDKRQASYDFRIRCYELIYKVIIAVDELSAEDPGFVDGQYTVVARRKNEAYDVIACCKDEVFLTSLYDWYLAQGMNDRLLAANSPFVVTYLRRKSNEDVTHADLLCKYYCQMDRFHEAAEVQLQLALSRFALPLSRRIEYLGHANSNASVFTPDVSPRAKQQLLRKITEYMDAAKVQDDLLQHLRQEERMTPMRRQQVVAEVGGQILNLAELFNLYADPCGYHDICLQIMHFAQHKNTSDIKVTWENLINETYEKASQDETGPQPYEVIIERIRTLAGRLDKSPMMFPVPIILPMLEAYVIGRQLGVGPQGWVVDLFLDLETPHEAIFGVLESIFFNNEVPFHGKNRRHIAADLIYLIRRWFESTIRVGGGSFSGEIMARRVCEVLHLLQQCGLLDVDSVQLCRDLQLQIMQSMK